ncbi:hypothetical protein [Paenibacillus nasutitermitis]|uniref:Uncharacterized protein n=1 Tax=Paenibacillus nasutitermitis TaxID=1652958 RepID=A0A916Z9Q4_9BACL|nr:hypothetical protein [Paenibacillus nasutitermitis]GGD83367.1 hypothetical protein GCM10010911_46910 [Paenibacillus nasutitermitis]
MRNETFEARLHMMERWIIASAFILSALFVVVLAAVKWPSYWIYLAAEQTPMTWLQSVIWFGCVLMALLCCMLTYARDGFKRRPLNWLLLSAAFAFLMADERFAFHERVRDHYLKSTGIKFLPWMEAGDFILLVYAIVALALAVYVIRLYRVRRLALVWLIISGALFALAVGMDTFDVSRMSKAAERLEQTLEEIVELFAVLSLLSSLMLMVVHHVMHEAPGPGPDPQPEADPAS